MEDVYVLLEKKAILLLSAIIIIIIYTLTYFHLFLFFLFLFLKTSQVKTVYDTVCELYMSAFCTLVTLLFN